MCLSKKIFTLFINTLLVFCSAWDSFSSENILYVIDYIALKTEKRKYKGSLTLN